MSSSIQQRLQRQHLLKDKHGFHEPTIYERANIVSKYFYFFLLPILRLSRRRVLTTDDIDGPSKDDKSTYLGLKLVENWNKELTASNKNPKLYRAIINTFKYHLGFYAFYESFADLIFYPLNTVTIGWVLADTTRYTSFKTYAQIAPVYIANNSTSSSAQQATNITSFGFINNSTTGNINYNNSKQYYLEQADEVYRKIAINLTLVVIYSGIGALFAQPHYFFAARLGMRVRVSVCQLIYRKALKLNQSALMQTTVGQLINMLSGDVNRFDQAGPFVSYLLLGPLQAIIVTGLLAKCYIGFVPAIAGLVAILVYIMIQTIIGKSFTKFRVRTATKIDDRVRLMNETIPAMRIIKMYVWERPFSSFVKLARKLEIKAITITSILRGISQGLFFISSKVISFVALLVYFASGAPLTAEVVFVTIGLSNLLRISLTLYMPTAIATCAEAFVSCQRIGTFLTLPEIETRPKNYVKTNDAKASSDLVYFNKVTASWTQTSKNSELYEDRASDSVISNLSMNLESKDLLLIVGRVGGGKSSVLNAITGELPISNGNIQVNGRVSYASQEPWIFSGTVRDNVLFGLPFEPPRYRNVLKVCSLDKDLEQLVDGDLTTVGEKGVSLSGGQKARVNLARALYREADIYLLDDPLSAVDAPVAKHIFEKCLQVFLKKKLVVIVTHQLQFLRFATKVLVVGGHNSQAVFGTVEQVAKSQAFADLNYSKTVFDEVAQSKAKEAEQKKLIATRHRQTRRMSTSSTGTLNSLASQHFLDAEPQKALEGSEQRAGKEKVGTISADWSTYKFYIGHAFGIWGSIYFIVVVFMAHFLFQFVDFYLSLWTNSEERKRLPDFKPESFIDYLTPDQSAVGYVILLIILTFVGLLLAFSLYFGTLRASIKIHNQLFRSVVCAPMRFFDFSPIGILLNRFANDINAIDEVIPFVLLDVFIVLGNIFAVLILSMIVYPLIIPVGLLVFLACYGIHQYSATSICRLKQIENVNRSPIYSHLATTISGIATIRVSKAQDRMLISFSEYQDIHTKIAFTTILAGRWLAIATKWLLIVYLSILTTAIMIFSFDSLDASTLGLLLSQTTSIQSSFQHAMRQLVEFENQMTSVQRVKDFCFIEPEDRETLESITYDSKKKKDPKTKPGKYISLDDIERHSDDKSLSEQSQSGTIEFKNVTLSYFEDEAPVLKDLNFKVNQGEKIGVVGRTGAGKSSIIAALFRLYNFDGKIEIGGVDTKAIALTELRGKMSIIPQDPILFGASIRKNLDPIEEHKDEDLWRALEIVQLKSACPTLDFEVTEGGANFSVGQRQLICLARAILRRNQILMLDEATANVDPETDSYIQDIISTEFKHCTVITIAHRLITITASDKVLVMDAGRVAEFGSPIELSSDKDTIFSQMIDSSLDASKIRGTIMKNSKSSSPKSKKR